MNNFAQAYRPSFANRVWFSMGFGRRMPDTDDVERDPRFVEGCITTVVQTHLDWKDRLRVLISGHITTYTRTYTDVTVDTAVSVSAVGVEPPGHSA